MCRIYAACSVSQTPIINFDPEEWDGPTSLHDMMRSADPIVLKYTPDYKLNLIDPSFISEEELKKFSIDLGEVLTLIKYSKDAKKFREYALNNKDLTLDQQAARVVNVITDLNISISDGEEEIKMCDAMKQIIAEENAIAANAAVLQNNIRFVLKGKISVEDAAEACNLSVDDFLKKKEEYEKTKH